MTLLAKTTLRPASGQIFYCEILLLKNSKRLQIQDFDFSKDITGPTGDGKATIAFFSGYDNYMAEGDQFKVLGAWMESANPNALNTTGTNTKVDPKVGMGAIGKAMGAKPFILNTPPTDEIVHGVIKKVKVSRTTIEIDFTDMGILLEATAITGGGVSGWGSFQGIFDNWSRHDLIEYIIGYSGLDPLVNVSGSNNDIIPKFSPQLATADAANTGETKTTGICAIGSPSSAHSTLPYRFYQACVENHCPVCGKNGTLGNANKRYPGVWGAGGTGEITCLSSKGGCDSDFSIPDGWVKLKNKTQKLTLVSGPTAASGPARFLSSKQVNQINVATIEANTGDTATSSSTTSNKTSWWIY